MLVGLFQLEAEPYLNIETFNTQVEPQEAIENLWSRPLSHYSNIQVGQMYICTIIYCMFMLVVNVPYWTYIINTLNIK